MHFDPAHSLALLERTPGVLNAWLRGLPADWTEANEGGNSWAPVEVVAHYLHTERTNWMPRARTIRMHGSSQPFPPFDRFGQRNLPEDRALDALLDAFAVERAASMAELRGWAISPADLEREGQHPALGPTTLAELLAAWTVHDLTHLHQLTRLLAHQYNDAVGPFHKFLGVLHCSGHSQPA